MQFYKMGEDGQIKELPDIYEKYFGKKIDGTFVEIGAYDGYEWSNTYGLMTLGWNGIEVEANPDIFPRLVNNCKPYPNIISFNIAVGKDSICNLYSNGAISTTSKEQSNIYRNCDWFHGNEKIIQVPMVTLDHILESNGIKSGFEVLVVDTEGTEFEVLESFSINKWQPKMVIVEAHELHPTKGFNRYAKQINKYFEMSGYDKIYCDIINNIYVDRRINGN